MLVGPPAFDAEDAVAAAVAVAVDEVVDWVDVVVDIAVADFDFVNIVVGAVAGAMHVAG